MGRSRTHLPLELPLPLIGWNISPALAAGNTAVIKPAEDTPLSALYLAHLAKEIDIPDGVINVVPGFGNVTGAALAAHPGLKRMSFTGSPEVGRLIGAACGKNLVPVKLELGGKGAAVVFDDVNVLRRPKNWSAPSRSTRARSVATLPAGSSTDRSTTVSSMSASNGSVRCESATKWPLYTDGAGRE